MTVIDADVDPEVVRRWSRVEERASNRVLSVQRPQRPAAKRIVVVVAETAWKRSGDQIWPRVSAVMWARSRSCTDLRGGDAVHCRRRKTNSARDDENGRHKRKSKRRSDDRSLHGRRAYGALEVGLVTRLLRNAQRSAAKSSRMSVRAPNGRQQPGARAKAERTRERGVTLAMAFAEAPTGPSVPSPLALADHRSVRDVELTVRAG